MSPFYLPIPHSREVAPLNQAKKANYMQRSFPPDEGGLIDQRNEHIDRNMRMLLLQDRNQHLLIVTFGEERDLVRRGEPEDDFLRVSVHFQVDY